MLNATFLVAAIIAGTVSYSDIDHLGSKTPYHPRQTADTYTETPDGFSLAMIQHVARHGSRGLSSADDDVLVMQVLQLARKQRKLTPLGEKLIPQITELTRVQNKIGYGMLSTIGRNEHRDMAKRMVERHTTFFSDAELLTRPIYFSHSGRARAAQSGEAFKEGLLETLPGLSTVIKPSYESQATLYFHKAEGADDYKEYKNHDPRIMSVMTTLEHAEHTHSVTRHALERLFAPSFVTELEQGNYHFQTRDKEDEINTAQDVADALYGLYAVAPDLDKDSNTLNMKPFISDVDAGWLSYLDDAESFYGRGPGFKGSDITYRAANALFAEMLEQIELLQGSPDEAPMASFRFTHAQVMMPVATWLQLKGTAIQMAEDEPYTYDNNPWRSAEISPMAANVQWEIYSNDKKLLVRMLHNEEEVGFPSTCEPIEEYPYFYEFGEIKHCLKALRGIDISGL